MLQISPPARPICLLSCRLIYTENQIIFRTGHKSYSYIKSNGNTLKTFPRIPKDPIRDSWFVTNWNKKQNKKCLTSIAEWYFRFAQFLHYDCFPEFFLSFLARNRQRGDIWFSFRRGRRRGRGRGTLSEGCKTKRFSMLNNSSRINNNKWHIKS